MGDRAEIFRTTSHDLGIARLAARQHGNVTRRAAHRARSQQGPDRLPAAHRPPAPCPPGHLRRRPPGGHATRARRRRGPGLWPDGSPQPRLGHGPLGPVEALGDPAPRHHRRRRPPPQRHHRSPHPARPGRRSDPARHPHHQPRPHHHRHCSGHDRQGPHESGQRRPSRPPAHPRRTGRGHRSGAAAPRGQAAQELHQHPQRSYPLTLRGPLRRLLRPPRSPASAPERHRVRLRGRCPLPRREGHRRARQLGVPPGPQRLRGRPRARRAHGRGRLSHPPDHLGALDQGRAQRGEPTTRILSGRRAPTATPGAPAPRRRAPRRPSHPRSTGGP